MEPIKLEPINTDHIGWLEAMRQIADTEKERIPRVLLVDDDPIFCQSAAQLAKKRGLALTVCQTIGELFRVSNRTFDVAVLDYSFGELTALQIAPMLRENTPLLLISGMSRSEVHYADWPFSIESFVSKGSGLERIFRRAMEIAKFSGEPRGGTGTGASTAGWLLLLAAITVVGLGVLYLSSTSTTSWQRLRWDAVDTGRNFATDYQEALYERQTPHI